MATALVRTAFLVNATYAESAGEHGLTPQQGQLLCVLMQHPYGMGELGATLRLAKSSMTGLVDRSERNGLVRREPDPDDLRAVRVALTPQGAYLAAEFYEGACRRIEQLTSPLSTTEREALRGLLDRVVHDNETPPVFMNEPQSIAVRLTN